jgi:vitamin B12 transporter
MIDGVPVTDASGINLSYDLRLLPVDQIESIEIMKVLQVHFTVLSSYGCYHHSEKQIKKAIAGNVYMNMGTKVAKENSTKINDFNQGFL